MQWQLGSCKQSFNGVSICPFLLLRGFTHPDVSMMGRNTSSWGLLSQSRLSPSIWTRTSSGPQRWIRAMGVGRAGHWNLYEFLSHVWPHQHISFLCFTLFLISLNWHVEWVADPMTLVALVPKTDTHHNQHHSQPYWRVGREVSRKWGLKCQMAEFLLM